MDEGGNLPGQRQLDFNAPRAIDMIASYEKSFMNLFSFRKSGNQGYILFKICLTDKLFFYLERLLLTVVSIFFFVIRSSLVCKKYPFLMPLNRPRVYQPKMQDDQFLK